MDLRFRAMRKACGKSQAQIAEILCCTQQSYSRYETGQVQPPVEIVFRLADYYGTSIDYLLGLTDEMIPHPPSKRKT